MRAVLVALIGATICFLGVPAAIAAPPVCSGTDFRDGSAVQKRALAEAEAAAASVRNGEGVFWRIEPKGGGTPTHLLGTMHTTDPRITALSEARRAALAEARVIAVENRASLDLAVGGETRTTQLGRMIFTDGRRLTDLLDEPARDALRAALARRHIPLWLVAGLRPWAVTFGLLQYTPCEILRIAAHEKILDRALYDAAVAAGKETADLETLDRQIDHIDGIPLDLQLALLKNTVEIDGEAADRLETAVRLYREGRPGVLLRLMILLPSGTPIAEDDLRLVTDRLLDRRNADMFDTARRLVDDGGAFLAAGAGHLVGETGLVARFQDAGYVVRRVE